MAFPDNAETAPTPRSTNLGSNDGTKHSVFDAATWATLGRVQTFLVGSGSGQSTLLARLNQIVAATQTIRTVAGTSTAVAIGPNSGDNDTGITFPSDGQMNVYANSELVSTITSTIVSIFKTFVVSAGSTTPGSAKVFFPGIGETVSGGNFVKRDGTAGELLWASSRRALKENFAPLNGDRAVEVIRQLKPTFFDAIKRDSDRPGVTVGIAGFIAEELAEIDEPGLAALLDDDTPIGRNDEAILTFTVAALQNALARIEALEAR